MHTAVRINPLELSWIYSPKGIHKMKFHKSISFKDHNLKKKNNTKVTLLDFNIWHSGKLDSIKFLVLTETNKLITHTLHSERPVQQMCSNVKSYTCKLKRTMKCYK